MKISWLLRFQSNVLNRVNSTRPLYTLPHQGILTCCVPSRNVETSSSPTPNTSSEFHDVVIVGGGLVGTCAAIALGKLKRLSPKKILLVEALPKSAVSVEKDLGTSEDPKFSNRVVALSPASQSFLEELGVWKNVKRSRQVSCMQVWDALSDASISFNYPKLASPVAHIVENDALMSAMVKCAAELPNVSVKYESSIKSCEIPQTLHPALKSKIYLKDGTQLASDLLVGADGIHSKVREAMDCKYIEFQYDRTAVVATLKLSGNTENNVAWQRFLPCGGPIALLPLSSNYSSLVWSTTPESALEQLRSKPATFVDAVNSAFCKDFGKSQVIEGIQNAMRLLNVASGPRLIPPSISQVVENSRASFPLGFGHSVQYAKNRVVLIGDAAHRVHPLAGQGLNLGLGDVDSLRRTVDEAVEYGQDIGQFSALKGYETERQTHNVTIQSSIDGLHRLYSYEATPVVALRSIGLSLCNRSDTLKNAIMKEAAT